MFGGIFILLGLFYRPMALFLVGNLMMAASIELAPGAPLLQGSRPFEEGVFYIGVVFAGPGRYSLDHLFRNEVGEEKHNHF
ncbi:DoxX family protein [Dialister succinatiphilus]|uniref:DoxX family protein n=1 Tax=Dialister succinatiphilus TaxID=487173 RepID=UPI003AF12048